MEYDLIIMEYDLIIMEPDLTLMEYDLVKKSQWIGKCNQDYKNDIKS